MSIIINQESLASFLHIFHSRVHDVQFSLKFEFMCKIHNTKQVLSKTVVISYTIEKCTILANEKRTYNLFFVWRISITILYVRECSN